MRLLIKSFGKSAAFLEYIACTFIMVSAVITLANILMRLIFKSPIYGTMELVQYGVLLSICFGLPSCTLHQVHAKVTFLVDALSKTGRAIMLTFVNLISIILFSVISYKLFDSVAAVLKNGKTTDVFKVPYQYVYFAIIGGLFLMVLTLVCNMISVFVMRGNESDASAE